jgi:hypothetical protein
MCSEGLGAGRHVFGPLLLQALPSCFFPIVRKGERHISEMHGEKNCIQTFEFDCRSMSRLKKGSKRKRGTRR